MNNRRIDGKIGFPGKQGLYDPALEKDSCGVGFVAHVKGVPSHEILTDAYHINSRMDHRGGCGFEQNTGDGAGIMTAIPHKFMQRVSAELGFSLPEAGTYAVGNVFLPHDPAKRADLKASLTAALTAQELTVIGFREVPVRPDEADIGPAARAAMPFIEQVIVGYGTPGDHRLDHALYVARKTFIRAAKLKYPDELVYVCSLNSRILVYKGMLTPDQLFPFYPDLEDADFESHFAMVHSRFSTNTFPSWDRAQPNRFMSHNGEINTLRGNKNWMTARQGVAVSDRFGDKIKDLFPIVEPDFSDSGTFDNVLEFLLMSGRTLQESIMMMIPEAWQSDVNMPREKRDFYEYHSALMEPWDGPASIAFTDGHYIGAVLDRNGLRPSRYYLTHDDKVVMASEVGVLPIAPENVKEKGRLQPGKMFLVDFFAGRLIPDAELKMEFARKRPYGQWLKDQKLELADLPPDHAELRYEPETLVQRMQAFGYTVETMQFMLLPMVSEARDPLGSMGNDSALACLSDKSRMIYDYFKQLFAQITNPPIDSIREEVVMSLTCFIGPEKNLLETTPEHVHRLELHHPVISNDELTNIRNIDRARLEIKDHRYHL